MRLAFSALFVVALASTSCRNAPPSRASSEVDVGPVTTTTAPPAQTAIQPPPTATTDAPDASAPREPRMARMEMPPEERDGPALGAPCEDGTPGCGRSRRIAVTRRSYHTPAPLQNISLPCKPETITKSPPASYRVASCVAGGVVVVESLCVMCRLDTRQLAVARIDEMLPEQLADVQKLASFEGQPPLTTEKAWQSAITKAAADARR